MFTGSAFTTVSINSAASDDELAAFYCGDLGGDVYTTQPTGSESQLGMWVCR